AKCVCGTTREWRLEDSDDQDAGATRAVVRPAAQLAAQDRGGVALAHLDRVGPERQVDLPLQDERELLARLRGRVLPAAASRLQRDQHGLDDAPAVHRAQRLERGLGPL